MDKLEITALSLSILGGTILALKFAIAAQAIWAVSSTLWLIHFRKREDIWAQRLFAIYLIQHLAGVFLWNL